MNADAILAKIEEDARLTAARLGEEAKAKAEGMRVASREKIEAMHRDILAQAEKEGQELEQRMLRMHALEEGKELLWQKRALIDEAFAKAREQLTTVPAQEKRAFFLQQIVRYARGNEAIVVGEVADGWFDEAFLAQANQALTAAGKTGELTLSQERLPGNEGVALRASGAQTLCTFEALLDAARPELETQVAQMLFGQ